MGVAGRVIQRIHNPRHRECGCDPDCWCRRTAVGRAVKWWFPAWLVGIHHKSGVTVDWKREREQGSEPLETRAGSLARADRGMSGRIAEAGM
jgi:hypothetical protein